MSIKRHFSLVFMLQSEMMINIFQIQLSKSLDFTESV